MASSGLAMKEDTLVLPRQHDAQGGPCALEAEYAGCFEMNCQIYLGTLSTITFTQTLDLKAIPRLRSVVVRLNSLQCL